MRDIHHAIGKSRSELAIMPPAVLAAELKRYTGRGGLSYAQRYQEYLIAQSSMWTRTYEGAAHDLYVLDGACIAEFYDGLAEPNLGYFLASLDSIIRAGFKRER